MQKATKIIYTILIILFTIFLLLTIPSLDWQNSWFASLSLLSIVLLLIMAIISFEKLILLLIIIMPIIFKFNYLKINIISCLPSLKNYTLLINPISVIYLLIIVLGIITIFEEWPKVKKMPLKFIILLTSIYVITSIGWSNYKNVSFIETIYFLIPFFMYLITYCRFSSAQGFIKILFAAIISSIIPLIAAIQQIITKQYFFEPSSSFGRLSGTFAHPNSLGLYLYVILCLSISYYLAKKNKKIQNNKLFILCILTILITFLLTYSRISWACLIVFLLLLTIIKHNLILLFAALSPVVAFISFTVENIKFRIQEIFSNALYSSWTARKNIWKISCSEIIKKPLFGHGIGTAETIIERAKTWRGGTSLPHNDIMLYAIELGASGVILFISYTLGAIYYTYKTYLALANKNTAINICGRKIEINFKILSFGILAMLLSIILASIFESASQKIIIQILIWSILGSLFGLKKEAPHRN